MPRYTRLYELGEPQPEPRRPMKRVSGPLNYYNTYSLGQCDCGDFNGIEVVCEQHGYRNSGGRRDWWDDSSDYY